MKFDVFTAVKIWVVGCWVMTPYSVMVGYQRFGGPLCLYLQVVTLCSDVVWHQRFGEPCCHHLHPELYWLDHLNGMKEDGIPKKISEYTPWDRRNVEYLECDGEVIDNYNGVGTGQRDRTLKLMMVIITTT